MGIVASDMRRAFVTPRFFIAVILVMFVRLFANGEISIAEDIVQTYRYNDEFNELMSIICGIPFITGFIEDWNGRVFLSYAARCGVERYALSKFFVAILAALTCSLIGNALYVAVLSFIGPMMLPGGSNHDILGTYFMGGALAQGRPLLFLFGQWLSLAFVQSMVMAIALCFSTYCTNPLISIISPFIIYFILSFLIWMTPVPGYMLPARQITGNMTENDARDLCIYLGETGVVLTITGCIYMRRIKELMRRA